MAAPSRWLTATVRAASNERARAARALGLLLGLCACSPGQAAADEAARGFELYMSECSKCHGAMTAGDSTAEREPHSRTLYHLAYLEHGSEGPCEPALSAENCRAPSPALAFALPFGPGLEGIVGRAAGTVPGFEYSKVFMDTLSGTIWDEAALDEYMTDSQARAPGIRMFYRQPDAGIRRLIIEFLKTRQ